MVETSRELRATIAELRAELERTLRLNVARVDPETLRDAEATLGEALAQRDGALEDGACDLAAELETVRAEMDSKWSAARLAAAAEKERDQTKLDDALRKYESLRSVERELVEWRRRAARRAPRSTPRLPRATNDVEAAARRRKQPQGDAGGDIVAPRGDGAGALRGAGGG